jgi:hypothetical protein
MVPSGPAAGSAADNAAQLPIYVGDVVPVMQCAALQAAAAWCPVDLQQEESTKIRGPHMKPCNFVGDCMLLQ